GSTALLSDGLEGLFVILRATLDARWQVTLVYALISLVALAAAIGLFEPLTRSLQCRRDVSRLRASPDAGLVVSRGGLLGLLAFGVLEDLRWQGINLFGWLLRLVTNAILPIIGLMFCLFLGRVLSRRRLEHAWKAHPGPAGHAGFVVWHGSLRYPTRVVLAL